MSILYEILIWCESLPDWQNDAIVRLFNKHTLDSDDLDDLFALLKAEHGIPDPEGRIAVKLTADHISVPVSPEMHIELLGIKNLVHVNALASSQKLAFAQKGLTVIYGDNASGKSGYSRVLKKACRARDQIEPILPNAKIPCTDPRIAEATFEIAINGNTQEVKWIDNRISPDPLSTISIFDKRCARAYLDDEDDFSYIPYGLDIFEGLANVCRQLKVKIEQERDQNLPDITPFEDLRGPTIVGILIENLSEKTDPDKIEIIATIKPGEVEYRESLFRSLNSENTEEKAEQFKLISQRINRIADNASRILTNIDQSKLSYFERLDRDFSIAQIAATTAAKKFTDSGQFLPGTGSEVWRQLFDAARNFSKEAYPEKPFPYLDMGAKCPLCQQDLKDGVLRLQQFDEYVQQESEKTVQRLFQELKLARDDFFRLNMSLGLDDETFIEISRHNKKLAETCRAVESICICRYEGMISAFLSHEWADIPPIPISPVDDLKTLVTHLNQESDILVKAASVSTRPALVSQLNELDARIRLSQQKESLLAVINKIKHRSILDGCLSAVRTKNISIKAREIAEKVITKDLGEALNAEFKNLGVADLNVELKSRSKEGKLLYYLKLNLPHAEDPRDILSEGEQRAIAISSFLAEVNINSGSGGIVFDDPVSSLDHRRRERVARRLAQEAGKRQVIIFTHDVYFLCVLIEETDKAGIPYITQSLVRRAYGFGIPEEGNPFEGMNTSERIGFLRKQQQEIAKIHQDRDEPEHRRRTIDAYQMLRDTWERAIEEVLFKKTVVRFRKGIETQRLKEVVVEDSDYVQIKCGMSKCSNYSHDKASVGGIAVPDPDELLKDIESLESWRKSVNKRGEDARKRRK
jgi:energy-coupling factor transporter ATP-binding protein EcfA2